MSHVILVLVRQMSSSQPLWLRYCQPQNEWPARLSAFINDSNTVHFSVIPLLRTLVAPDDLILKIAAKLVERFRRLDSLATVGQRFCK